MDNRKITAIIAANEKGGSGKTTLTDACAAVASASGLETLVVDADDGNSGYSRRAGKTSAIALDWFIKPAEAAPWAARHLENKDLAIFDFGANLMASAAPVTEFLGALMELLRHRGGRIIFLAVASPNAPGTGRLVRGMRDDFGGLGEVRLVENNLDGSGQFSASLATAGLKKARFPRIDPGIQAIRLTRAEPLINILRDPPTEYGLAMARYAAFLHAFATQEHVRDIFGEAGIAELASLSATAPPSPRYVIVHPRHATDDAIRANVALRDAEMRLQNVDPSEPQQLQDAWLAYLEAQKRYASF